MIDYCLPLESTNILVLGFSPLGGSYLLIYTPLNGYGIRIQTSGAEIIHIFRFLKTWKRETERRRKLIERELFLNGGGGPGPLSFFFLDMALRL